MPKRLSGHRCVYLNHIIIVTGGITGKSKLKTIYLYEVASNTWSKSNTVLQKVVYDHVMGQSITP